MPILENVIDDLIDEYEKAKRYGYVIPNPIAYALRQVWEKYKDSENKCLRDDTDESGE